jgi:hypothetical protein
MGRKVASFIPATTQVKNYWSSGGVSTIIAANYLPTIASGALGAGELGTVINITGSGWVSLLAAYSNSATPTHTIRCQVIVDGVTVFDATSDSIATTANKRALIVVGDVDTAAAEPPHAYPLRFNSSLVVNLASSQAGTDYVACAYEYQLT